MKICTKCLIPKELNEFPKRGNGYRHKCKKCTNEYNKPFVKNSKKKNWTHYRKLQNEWERNANQNLHYSILKKKFGTLEEFIFTAKTRLLILKRNIKKYEKL